MRFDNYNRLIRFVHSFFAPRSVQSVPDWCCQNLEFDEPRNRGPFNVAGREYCKEPLEWWSDDSLSDGALVWGAQTGKTGVIMGGASWKAVNDPDRFLWVMPTRDLCSQFSRTRLQPMWRRSKPMTGLIPIGRDRHDFSTFHMRLGASHFDLAWAGSPSALASHPCGTVVQDEIDKEPPHKREAASGALADQRTKNAAKPKRLKTSTPTITEGPIWQFFLKTDQRRWFVPCPHCGKFIVLVWSKAFTMLRPTTFEAEVKWDPGARRMDRTWDLDAVEASAHVECCHCHGKILDGHKTAMNRAGEWRPTAQSARSYRGWHLPSLYSISVECNFGRLARKFLQAKSGLTGLQDFINSDLGEPYMSQDTQEERIEIVTETVPRVEGRRLIGSFDVQSDCFWFVVMSFGPADSGALGDCHTVAAGRVESWEEVEELQKHHAIHNFCMVIDSGDRTKGTGYSVYVQCAEHAMAIPQRDSLPALVGWSPAKGFPAKKRWKDKATGVELPYHTVQKDPYEGTSKSNLFTIGLFEFSGEVYKDKFDGMRRRNGRTTWSVSKEAATDEFWKHLDSNYKDSFLDKKRRQFTYGWRKKNEYWPDHLLDATVQGLAFAESNGLIVLE